MEGGLDLALNLKAVKQRKVVLILLEPVLVLRHNHTDELCSALVGGGVIDQYLIDVVAEVVAHCANNDVAFLINQDGCFTFFVRLGDRFPELQQVVQVPLKLLGAASNARGADNHTHTIGQIQL